GRRCRCLFGLSFFLFCLRRFRFSFYNRCRRFNLWLGLGLYFLLYLSGSRLRSSFLFRFCFCSRFLRFFLRSLYFLFLLIAGGNVQLLFCLIYVIQQRTFRQCDFLAFALGSFILRKLSLQGLVHFGRYFYVGVAG